MGAPVLALALALALGLPAAASLRQGPEAPDAEPAPGQPAPAVADPVASDGAPGAVPGAGPEDGAEALRERWAAKTDEEKRLLRERFEALRRLDPAERAELLERAEGLKRERKAYREGLDGELRERLEHLPSWERDQLLREQQRAELESRGRALRSGLDPEQRAWLEGLVEPGVPRPPKDLRDRLRGRFGERAIGRLHERGHLSDADRDRLLGLDGPERVAELLRLERARILARVAEAGPPEDLAPETWAALAAELSDERFVERARALGLSLLDRGRDRRDRRGPGGPDGPGVAPGGQHPGPEAFLPADAPAWAPALMTALRPTLADRLEFRGLERSERRAALDALRAGRLRAALEGTGALTEAQRAGLAALEPADVVRLAEGLLEREVFGGRPLPRAKDLGDPRDARDRQDTHPGTPGLDRRPGERRGGEGRRRSGGPGSGPPPGPPGGPPPGPDGPDRRPR